MIIYIRLKTILFSIASLLLAIIFFVFNQSFATLDMEEDKDRIYLPIIMYHEIKAYKLGKDVISPSEFESDLKYLKENHYHTITMTDLINYVYFNEALPENPIILSFDDGYLNNYKYTLPLLKKYEMKIVFSILGKNTDDFTRIPDDNLDYSHVTWDQLNEMLNTGLVEVQNHTYNLHSPGKGRMGCMQKQGESFSDYEKVLTEDITKLQDEILFHTGKLPNTFTYPYGKYNANTIEIIKKLGFKASLSCNYGINIITKDPERLYNLKRICRSHEVSIETVLKKGFKTVKKIVE